MLNGLIETKPKLFRGKIYKLLTTAVIGVKHEQGLGIEKE